MVTFRVSEIENSKIKSFKKKSKCFMNLEKKMPPPGFFIRNIRIFGIKSS